MFSLFYILFLLPLIYCSIVPQHSLALPKRLIADYGYWSKSSNPPYSSDNIPFDKVSHVNHDVGLEVNLDGTITVTNSYLEPQLLTRAHAANVLVMVLLGGPGATYNSVCGNPTLREKLVNEITSFIKTHGYDGADVDWEYPANATDRQSMVSFLTELRNGLPKPRYLLSIDLPVWYGSGWDVASLDKVIDFWNVMAYDYAGPWTKDGQLNSPIFPDPANPDNPGSVKDTIDKLLNDNIPPTQINMGTPFYGYYYQNVPKLFAPCQNCENTVLSEKYPYVKQLLKTGDWIENQDTASQVPYLLRKDGKPGFITYDNANSTYTRVYYSVWTRGLGGTFMWALDQDYDGQSQDLLDAMYAATMKTPPEDLVSKP
jgi:chitinase